MNDATILEPSIDPTTRKLAVRHVKAVNHAGTRTEIKVRDFEPVYTDEPSSLGGTNTAPSPLETVLVSLVGCDGVIINGVAKAMDFDYVGVDFDCQSQLDVRGPKGVPGVRPYFESVDLIINLYTDEPRERVDKLIKNVEFRCPVMNLLRAADVTLNVQWNRHASAQWQG
jgi:uncharacterized OsmC-like protein